MDDAVHRGQGGSGRVVKGKYNILEVDPPHVAVYRVLVCVGGMRVWMEQERHGHMGGIRPSLRFALG